jgi:putative two-component system response regulator
MAKTILDLGSDPAPPTSTVLVVDDEAQVRSFFRRLLKAAGYGVVFAHDARSTFAAIAEHGPDVVLLDINLPGESGIEICRRIRRDTTTRLMPIIIVTAVDARAERIAGLGAGADDFLIKPVDNDELLTRVRSLARMKRYTDDLDSATAIITTLATMIEARDGYGTGHCHRMANTVVAVGRALNVSDTDQQALYRGGFLHDIGMLAIPESVLRKPGALEPDEYELIKSHTVVGESLCANLRSLQPVRPLIRSHHERLDGSGYPDGLRGDAIPLLAQIVGVVDVFEAVTSERPYQQPLTPEQAIALLQSQVEKGWRRADIVNAFAAVVSSRSGR